VTDTKAICEYLKWDSEFFGLRIARVAVAHLNEKLAAEIYRWCACEKIDCLYFLADSSDRDTVALAQEQGFRLVDVRITFEANVGDAQDAGRVPEGYTFRKAEEADIPMLRKIAREAHRDSRFYCDGSFPIDKCDTLFETWIENSFRGWADSVIVADAGSGAVGYLTCHIRSASHGQIGLVGLAQASRGRGVGASLLKRGAKWLADAGVHEVNVVTQARNVPAQRLYQKCGFRTKTVEFWFHQWLSPGRQGRNE
jgi:dTDP-4-amino-4,6-dideoxy-D-galactose acyltransferase